MQRLLIVGAWRWPQYEEAFGRALQGMGLTIIEFSTQRYFRSLFGRLQQRVPAGGPAVESLNRELVETVTKEKPDSVLFWRPTHILPSALAVINSLGILTISYNNDDPFGPRVNDKAPLSHHWLWRLYLATLPLYKMNFFYRSINCREALYYGASHADILLPYFLPWQDKPVSLTEDEMEKFGADICFVGHYEPDGRKELIVSILNAGVKVKLWGGEMWQKHLDRSSLQRIGKISLAEGADYTRALCGANICLGFLSKLNRDTYTRRCFEIPACGRLLLAERTDDLRNMFEEDKEACYFSSREELLEKIAWLLRDSEGRERIATAGLQRVWKDGHDVYGRARNFLDVIEKHQRTKDG